MRRCLPTAVRRSEAAECKEGRVTVVRRQEIEDRPGPRGRAVVERERDDVFADVMPLLERRHPQQS